MTEPAPLDPATGSGAGVPDRAAATGDSGPTGTILAPSGLDAAGRPWPPFAHGSETEMARILDFYGVHWEYEPRTFPILWNLDGEVVESFAPDFYLPELDLFLELTTLKQRLVRKKNRKLRRLRELYPDIRIKLFYARDFRAMMLKYGRLALADSMSGTLGQVVPDRAREIDPIPAISAGETLDPDAVAAGDERGPAAIPADAPSEAPGEAPGEPAAIGGPPPSDRSGTRRNASRSRRRRAAAAARRATREPGDAPIRPPTGQPRKEPTSR